MSASPIRLLSLVLGLLLLGAGLQSGRSVPASFPQSTHRSASPDTSDTSRGTPYRTNRGPVYHLLAAPAYVLHGATRPIGWGIKYLEQRYPEVFEFRAPTRGVRPLVELGGPTGFLAGLVLYDRRVFGSAHSLRAEALYGGPDTFEGRITYDVPAPLGPRTELRAAANVFSDPRNEFYVGGNDSDRDADEISFLRRQFDVTLGLRTAAPRGRVRIGGDVLYEHVEVLGAKGLSGAASLSGVGTADLLTPRLLLGLDFTRGRPRTYAGTELLLQLDYTHDLAADRFRYGRYVIGLRQYLPVGIFPRSRRLALRARLEQVFSVVEGASVPFYQLPDLGGKRTLRGFRARRFQDEGSLLLTAEYRYPIWRTLDALFFVDAGQVFSALGGLSAHRFHWSYGGGLHLLNRRGLAFRFEVAGGAEGLRTILTVEPSFRHGAR